MNCDWGLVWRLGLLLGIAAVLFLLGGYAPAFLLLGIVVFILICDALI